MGSKTSSKIEFKHAVDQIISQRQFQMSQSTKEQKLLSIMKIQLENHIKFNENMKKFYKNRKMKPTNLNKLSDIPPLPVQMFKFFDLRTCPEEDIVRILHSSATTTGIPSKIYIDKTTGFRQRKALTSTVKNFIGKERKPFLVIDEDVNKGKNKQKQMTARGAAIRGFANFAKTTTFVMDNINGQLVINFDRLMEFVNSYKKQEVIIFGFTYIIWSKFLQQVKKKGIETKLPKMKLLHGGGWKKLTKQAVSKPIFNNEIAKIFGTKSKNIIDYYGMVEQLGVVFLDCEYGHKHVPDFAEIIIRDFYSMEEVSNGKEGLIECISILPTSYPGQSLLTEDVGKILGVDNCPCGRKNKYFTFIARAEKAEIRGCGDTFAERIDDQDNNDLSIDKQNSFQNDEWNW